MRAHIFSAQARSAAESESWKCYSSGDHPDSVPNMAAGDLKPCLGEGRSITRACELRLQRERGEGKRKMQNCRDGNEFIAVCQAALKVQLTDAAAQRLAKPSTLAFKFDCLAFLSKACLSNELNDGVHTSAQVLLLLIYVREIDGL